MVRGVLHFLLSQKPSATGVGPTFPLQPVRYFKHRGDWLGLEGFIRAHQESQPRDTWAWALLGEVLSLQGKHEEAVEVFREGLCIQATDPCALLGLGCAFMRQGSMDAALAVFREAQRSGGELPEITYNLGQIYAKAGKNGSAIQHLKEAVLQDPADAKSWLALGRIYLDAISQSEDKESGFKDCYTRLQEIDPDLARQLLKERLFRKQSITEQFSE